MFIIIHNQTEANSLYVKIYLAINLFLIQIIYCFFLTADGVERQETMGDMQQTKTKARIKPWQMAE